MTRRMVSAAFTLITLAFAASSAAQVSPGRIDASFERLTGARVAGVAVEIDGPQKQSAVTDAAGDVRFLNLASGTYTMRASHAGFSDYLNTMYQWRWGADVRFDLDVFNLFGRRTVLARQYNLRLSGFDEPLETMHPRLVRLGARITF